MANGLTWTIMLIKDWYDYLDLWLNQLRESNDLIIRSELNMKLGSRKTIKAPTRNDLLKFFIQLEIIEEEDNNKRNPHIRTKSNGRNLYIITSDMERKKQLHNLMLKYLFHYKFAFQHLIKNQLYEAEFDVFFEKLLEDSLNSLGFPIYDTHSFDNIKNTIKSLNSVYTVNDSGTVFQLKKGFQIKFNQEKFITEIKKILRERGIQEYTVNLCAILNQRKHQFLSTDFEYYDEKIIFHKVLDLDFDFLEYTGGLARRYVPANFALVKLKE